MTMTGRVPSQDSSASGFWLGRASREDTSLRRTAPITPLVLRLFDESER